MRSTLRWISVGAALNKEIKMIDDLRDAMTKLIACFKDSMK